MSSSSKPRTAGLGLSLLVVAGLLAAACENVPLQTPTSSPTPPGSTPAPAVAVTPTATSNAPAAVAPLPVQTTDLRQAVIAVTEQVRPAVVNITNEQVLSSRFAEPLTVPAGVGSGVIYDNEGHILTNNHVIEDAENLIVTLPDGRSFQARLVGGDAQTDLAVLQIEGENLPVAQQGD
jgi:serine protease Do